VHSSSAYRDELRRDGARVGLVKALLLDDAIEQLAATHDVEHQVDI
jgi:hypothetical protein